MKQVLLLLVLYFVICVFGERQEKDFYEPEPLGNERYYERSILPFVNMRPYPHRTDHTRTLCHTVQ